MKALEFLLILVLMALVVGATKVVTTWPNVNWVAPVVIVALLGACVLIAWGFAKAFARRSRQ
jgi:hypothetical protein